MQIMLATELRNSRPIWFRASNLMELRQAHDEEEEKKKKGATRIGEGTDIDYGFAFRRSNPEREFI